MADNRIVIDTKMENRGIIKGVRDATRHLEKVTDGYKGANAQIQLQKDGIQRLNDQLSAARQEAVKIGEAYAKAKAALPTKRPKEDVEAYEKQRLEVERINQEYREANKNVSSLSGELRKSTLELNRMHGEASSYQFLQTKAAENLVKAQERLVQAQGRKIAAIREETELVQTSQNTWKAMTAAEKAHWEQSAEYAKLSEELKRAEIEQTRAAMSETAGAAEEVSHRMAEQTQTASAVTGAVNETKKSAFDMKREFAETTMQPLRDDLEAARNMITEISAELKRLQAAGEAPRGVVGMQRTLEASSIELNKLEAILSKASTFAEIDFGIRPETAAMMDSVASGLKDISGGLSEIGERAGITSAQMDTIPATMNKTSTAATRQASIFRELAAVAASVGSGIRKAFSGAVSIIRKSGKAFSGIGSIFKGIHRDTNTASNGFTRMGKRIFGLAIAALVFNQIRRQLRSLVSYYGEAMKQNVQLNASFALLKGSALSAFQPLYEAAIPIIMQFVSWLTVAIQQLGTFIALLFKVDPTKMQANAKAMWNNVKATKAGTKEQRRFLATFDELITMSDEAAGAGADMGEIVPDFDFTPPPIAPWMEKLVDWFKPIIDSIKGAWDSLFKSITSAFNRWKNKLLTSWKKMTDSIKALIISIIDTFKRLFETDIWAAFLDEAFKLLRNIMDLITAVSDAFRKAWETDDKGLKMLESITRVYKEILGLINDIIEAFIEAWNENDIGEKIISNILGIITNIADTIANIVENIREAWNANGNGVAIWTSILNIIETITGAIESITAATAEWAGNLDFEPLISSIRTAFEALEPVITKITDALAWLYEEILLPFGTWIIEVAAPAIMDNLITPLANLASTILDVVVPAMKDLWENVLKPIASWIGETFLFVIEEIGNVFDTVTESLKENSGEIKTAIDSVSKIFGFLWTNAVKPSLENVKKLFGDVFKFIGDTVSNAIRTFSGLVDFIKGVFTGDMELAMTGLANLFGGILNSFLIGLETLINLAVSAINGLVSGLNTGVSALNQIPGVNIPQIPQIPRAQLPRIPKLARGGIVDSATLAMIGERGREAVVPLERNTGWMDALVDKLTEKNYATTYEAFLDALDASGRMDDIITAILRRREERPDNQRIARETLDINNGRSQRLGATV